MHTVHEHTTKDASINALGETGLSFKLMSITLFHGAVRHA